MEELGFFKERFIAAAVFCDGRTAMGNGNLDISEIMILWKCFSLYFSVSFLNEISTGLLTSPRALPRIHPAVHCFKFKANPRSLKKFERVCYHANESSAKCD